MQNPHDQLPFNPYIHGTSSQALYMMPSTDYKIMPILEMLKMNLAPMVGELTKGGYDVISDDVGIPAFGRMQHNRYDLKTVIENYTKYSDNMSLDVCKKNFKDIFSNSHKLAFTNLNLLIIYLVRLRQLGVKTEDVATSDEIKDLKERLDATIQFYYFILCIQKDIFINSEGIDKFKNEHNLVGTANLRDYIEHYFSFENFLEKIRIAKLDIEWIFQHPSEENIDKLIDFVKIPKDSK